MNFIVFAYCSFFLHNTFIESSSFKAEISKSAEIFDLVKDGVLQTFSVGFRVKDADFLDDKKNIYTVRLSSMGTVDGEFTTGAGYLNVDGLWMSLGIKWSEESLLAKFGIDPSSKKSVDTNF